MVKYTESVLKLKLARKGSTELELERLWRAHRVQVVCEVSASWQSKDSHQITRLDFSVIPKGVCVLGVLPSPSLCAESRL